MGREDAIEHGAVKLPTYRDQRNKAMKFAIEMHDLIQRTDYLRFALQHAFKW
jgi:hypothetical protein